MSRAPNWSELIRYDEGSTHSAPRLRQLTLPLDLLRSKRNRSSRLHNCPLVAIIVIAVVVVSTADRSRSPWPEQRKKESGMILTGLRRGGEKEKEKGTGVKFIERPRSVVAVIIGRREGDPVKSVEADGRDCRGKSVEDLPRSF